MSAPYPLQRLRSLQYDAIYVSPHLDDAVYSCGGQLALARDAGKRVLTITVLGDGLDHATRARSKTNVFTDYSRREDEERAAAALLDIDHLWLNFPDLLARPRPLAELFDYALPFVALRATALQARIYAALEALIERLLAPGGTLFFPLAVGGHPDHRVVHTVGRALARTLPRTPVRYYEDIPYADVPALRHDRLRHLGLEGQRDALFTAAQQAHAFAFAHAPRWQRPLSLLAVTGHAVVSRSLFRALGSRTPIAQAQDLEQRIIDDVIDRKVAAMRAYESQTDYFFPAGDALYQVLSRADDHYVERSWRLHDLAAAPAVDPGPYLDDERARVDRLVQAIAPEA